MNQKWMFFVFAVICLTLTGFALFLLRLIRLNQLARKSWPLLERDPVLFLEKWEGIYRRARGRYMKNASLLMVAMGWTAANDFQKARERLCFVRFNDPFLNRDLANALQYALLLESGKTEAAALFLSKNQVSVERGKQSLPFADFPSKKPT